MCVLVHYLDFYLFCLLGTSYWEVFLLVSLLVVDVCLYTDVFFYFFFSCGVSNPPLRDRVIHVYFIVEF